MISREFCKLIRIRLCCTDDGHLSHSCIADRRMCRAGQCGLVVDAGFSFTHALPIFDGQLLEDGVRRINLGGKALTNYFKELVSYRCVQKLSNLRHLQVRSRESYFEPFLIQTCPFFVKFGKHHGPLSTPD